MPKFGMKNVLVGYFWEITSNILMKFLISAASNLCISKFEQNTKMPKFGTGNSWFWNIWASI